MHTFQPLKGRHLKVEEACCQILPGPARPTLGLAENEMGVIQDVVGHAAKLLFGTSSAKRLGSCPTTARRTEEGRAELLCAVRVCVAKATVGAHVRGGLLAVAAAVSNGQLRTVIHLKATTGGRGKAGRKRCHYGFNSPSPGARYLLCPTQQADMELLQLQQAPLSLQTQCSGEPIRRLEALPHHLPHRSGGAGRAKAAPQRGTGHGDKDMRGRPSGRGREGELIGEYIRRIAF